MYLRAMNAQKLVTCHGNLAGPGYQNLISWLASTWAEMPRDIIANSFIHCGIGEREPMNFHTILRDIFERGKTPGMGEMIVEDEVIENDHLVDRDSLFTDSLSELTNSSRFLKKLLNFLEPRGF
jgi:hypothetical protein